MDHIAANYRELGQWGSVANNLDNHLVSKGKQGSDSLLEPAPIAGQDKWPYFRITSAKIAGKYLLEDGDDTTSTRVILEFMGDDQDSRKGASRFEVLWDVGLWVTEGDGILDRVSVF